MITDDKQLTINNTTDM